MKPIFAILLLFLSCFLSFAQSSQDLSIAISTVLDKNTPSITLKWSSNAVITNYIISRKNIGATNWKSIGNVNSSTTTFEDKDIMIGAKYEYKIEGKGANFSSYGYIGSGIEIDRTLQVGKVILVIDQNVVDSLQPEIIRWTHDVQNEGWEVASLIVARDANVKSIRDSIKSIYSSTMIRPVSVFLFGHVPVPYSGNLAPDGHPDHQGAWPTDGYYGEVDNYFTDNQVNNTVASDGRNDNVPGDGKFDQSNFFGPLEMQVGRVDMYNLPAFGLNEIQLLRNYLNKDHAFRTGQFKPRHKAIIDDNFGYFSGEAFASSGWRNFSSLVGVDSTESGDYFTGLNANSYLWSYGCGGGNYSGAQGVGSTENFASTAPKGVFTLLFGSYFGDWDSQNNFMRAALASGDLLTCAWAGRPHWYFHHMGVGEPIGYCAQQSMSNTSTYYTHFASRSVHISLLGDPTLKQQYSTNPISGLTVTKEGSHMKLSWEAIDPSKQFFILKHESDAPSWELISTTDQNLFIDSCIASANLVRYKVAIWDTIKSHTATYTEALGQTSEFILTEAFQPAIADGSFSIDDNKVIFYNNSKNASSIIWDFGDGKMLTTLDGTVTYIYDSIGSYTVTMTVKNECSIAVKTFTINILTNTNDLSDLAKGTIYPNPASDKIYIRSTAQSVSVYNQLGNQVITQRSLDKNDPSLGISALPSGFYFVYLYDDNAKILARRKFVKE